TQFPFLKKEDVASPINQRHRVIPDREHPGGWTKLALEVVDRRRPRHTIDHEAGRDHLVPLAELVERDVRIRLKRAILGRDRERAQEQEKREAATHGEG